jgi:hypothetical protein
LAAVFETTVAELQQEPIMQDDINITQQEREVIDHVRAIKGFYSHAITYVFVIALLFVINFISYSGYIWAWWPALGWGIGLLSHGVNTFEVFNFFGPKWEKRQIEKRLGRKL